MALFTKDKKEEKQTEKSVATPKVVSVTDFSWVLLKPRMSEKAMYAADKNVYIFNVDPRANKKQVKEAIKLVYKVDAQKINISKIARKNVRNQRTGIKGVKSGGKKAYIYLKEGDKINVV